jgi:hypothetical protein
VNTLHHPRPLRKIGVTLHRSHGEITLHDPDDDTIHVVNATAAAIWELCDGETEDSEMVSAICHLTGMPMEIVQEDVAQLLAGFAEADLISWVGRNGDAPTAPGD